MRVFVVGGAGYVGSHAAKALARNGFEPVCLDDLSSGHAWAVRWGPLLAVDVCSPRAVDRAFAAWRPQAVMHFAARSVITESIAQPELYYRQNLGGVLNVLRAMRTYNVAPIVFSSTAAVYGHPTRTPIPETAPLSPITPYGRGKAFAEQILMDCAHAGQLSAVALRYFNAAGADPEGEIGEAHTPETHLVPRAVRAALDPEARLTVHGDTFATPDGTAIRDYVHVADLAAGHVAALRYLLDGGASAAFNLGTGHGTSVHEVIRMCERTAGAEIRRETGPARPGEPASLVADPRRAQAILDWQPRQSGLDRIVQTDLAWQRQRQAR